MPKPRTQPKIVERKLGREQAHGQYFPGSQTIELDPRLNGKKMLETAVHEALHFVFPFLTEEVVTSSAPKIASIVWKVGYRRITK